MPLDPILNIDSLASIGALVLLDVRNVDAFTEHHASNAVRVPIEIWEAAAKTDETSLANTAYWEAAIGELGIDGRLPVLVYDDGRMTDAARVWFILQYFGARAFLINGGWPVIRTGLGQRANAKEPTGPATFKADPGAGVVGLVDRQALQGELSGDVRIFDARTPNEFSGTDLRNNTRGGHLPGARLLPHANLIDNGLVRPASDLRQMLSDVGFQPGDHVVTHCDGGGRAALAAIAAVRAGYSDVRAYYLSFSDWAKDESCAIVTEGSKSEPYRSTQVSLREQPV